ncbi:MAG: hypothetical protein A2Z34_06830 [Planctomycetes bacterium RBG_16_59_8]|nr:MAG: hypothetical protein A2Z34_06830 [Planctomycetes bacterium RBG_16_59_8]
MEYESVDVRKRRIGPKETLELLAGVRRLWAKKGSKVIAIDRKKESPTDREILDLFLGTSGTMRAPVLVKGDKAMGGYDKTVYEAILAR